MSADSLINIDFSLDLGPQGIARCITDVARVMWRPFCQDVMKNGAICPTLQTNINNRMKEGETIVDPKEAWLGFKALMSVGIMDSFLDWFYQSGVSGMQTNVFANMSPELHTAVLERTTQIAINWPDYPRW